MAPNTDNDFVLAIALAREIQSDAEQRADAAAALADLAFRAYGAGLDRDVDLRELAELLHQWTAAEMQRVLAAHTKWMARHAYVQALQAAGGERA